MNLLESAKAGIIEFLENDRQKVLLLNGTEQFKKHLLALYMIGIFEKRGTLLFRTNTLRNAEDFLQMKSRAESGHAYTYNKSLSVYIDTNSSFLWKETPSSVDYCILYPLESIEKEEAKKTIVSDAICRTAKKVFIVSSKPQAIEDWLTEFVDAVVHFDASRSPIKKNAAF
ncbi:hypothetical protein [Bacillus testis]|uniref:hypothetical protein n=1 Tax=Bacillus testis TaxID=1622072 RepID=UPI00067ED075|nr:hypothetical protein [Bacillus testis]